MGADRALLARTPALPVPGYTIHSHRIVAASSARRSGRAASGKAEIEQARSLLQQAPRRLTNPARGCRLGKALALLLQAGLAACSRDRCKAVWLLSAGGETAALRWRGLMEPDGGNVSVAAADE